MWSICRTRVVNENEYPYYKKVNHGDADALLALRAHISVFANQSLYTS